MDRLDEIAEMFCPGCGGIGNDCDSGNCYAYQKAERMMEQAVYRHKKRGTSYKVLGVGKLQTATTLYDDSPVVVYQDEAGALWVRGIEEFNDGRFEIVDDGNKPVDDE